MKLNEKIKTLRKKKGLTQQELADAIGLHLTHTSRLENGHYSPSLEVLKKLIKLFDVSADYLLDDNSDNYEVQIEDKSLAHKVQLIDQINEEEKYVITKMIDAVLTNHKMRQLLNQETQELVAK